MPQHGLLTVPLAALLPGLRRKESSAKLKAKAEKTSAAIYFDCRDIKYSTHTGKQNFPDITGIKKHYLRIRTQGNT
jgi:hypothetical protein